MLAALYKEKLKIKTSNEKYILVDNSKFVNRLGEKHPVPIECKKEKIEEIENKVKQLGATNIEIRKSNIEDGPLITDNGNIILHAWFDKINEHLEEKILQIDGVIESGLFIGYDIIVIK